MKDIEEQDFGQRPDVKAGGFEITDIIYRYLYHWPLFLLSIVVCLIAAVTYLRYTVPVYQIDSTLLIKDKKSNASGQDLMNQMDLFSSSKVVDNEIAILKSRTLMRKVVDRLNLNVNYQNEGRVVVNDAYDDRPVDIVATDFSKKIYYQVLTLSFPDNLHYRIKNEVTGVVVNGNLDQFQRNNLGTYKIQRHSKFDSKRDVRFVITDPEGITSQCLARLKLNVANKQGSVIELTYVETVPQRGKEVLNTLVNVYNEASLLDKNRTTRSTIQFIDDRLKLISGELTSVEKEVEGFKSSHGLTDLSSDATLFLDGVKANDEKLSEVNLRISVIKDVERFVNANSSTEKVPTLLGIEDPVLLGQISQLSDLMVKRDALLATTQINNPIVEPILTQIERTRSGIKSNIANMASSIQNTKTALESNGSQYQSSIKKMPGQEREFISIKRQQTLKETLYLYLLQKKEEAALSYASTVEDSRVIDTAFCNYVPVSPKRDKIYLFAFGLGLVLPLGYLFVKDLLKNKVSGSSDVSKLTAVPLLGEIFNEEGTDAIVVQQGSRRAIAEQFRSIRTNMQFVYGRTTPGRGNVTLFTSSMSGEGKSFVASNLATAIAISGKKVVLLELDLRKPKVSKYLNLSNKIGLSNYLVGQATIDEILFPSGINENLFVIGSGPIPPNPSELLIGTEIEDLITYLRTVYDEILIDTAPIGLVTDAQILSKVADITIYLLRAGVTYKRQVVQLEELYKKDKFPKLNAILNGVEAGGQYGYGYGYGYYSDDHQNKFSFKAFIKNFYKRF